MTLKILILILIVIACYLIIRSLLKKPEKEYKSISFETRFTVTEIIDGDTFKISPGWKWNNKKGDTIRPIGYDTPEQNESGYQEAKEKLEQLLLNKEIELKNPVKLSYDRILCDVFVDGKNLAEFFPDYKA